MTQALTVYDEDQAGGVIKKAASSDDFNEEVEDEIPGMVYVLSLTTLEDDEENNPTVSNVDEYELPNATLGEEKSGGGSCTSAFIKAMKSGGAPAPTKKKKKKKKAAGGLTWASVLVDMQKHLKDELGLDSHVPTLSLSRPIDVTSEAVRMGSTNDDGVKRALLIGLQYEGDEDEDAHLSSSHSDLRELRKILIHEHGFEKQNLLNLMDDNGRHCPPTKKAILDSLSKLCEISEPGDSIFVLFSGHGGRLEDEDSGTHALLATTDYEEKGIGPILDDELYQMFVKKIPAGVECVAVIDPLHPPPSGGKCSALEMPYFCEAGDEEVYQTNGFEVGREMMGSAFLVAAAAAGAAAAGKKKKGKKKKGKKVEESSDDEEESEEEPPPKKKGKAKKKAPPPKKKKGKKKVESSEEEDSDDEEEEESSEEEPEPPPKKKGKAKKKAPPPKKKKGKKKVESSEEEDEDESDDDEEESSEEEPEPPPKKKGKAKKKAPPPKKKKSKKVESESEEEDDDEDDESEEEEKPAKKSKAKKKKSPAEEPKKKKKGLFGRKEAKEEDDGDDEEDEEPPAEEPKKKKKGLFGFRK